MTTTIKERTILFSAPMVRAILDGRKTQTRRVVKRGQVFRFCPGGDLSREERSRMNASAFEWESKNPAHPTMDELLAICPYGVPGDRLWVRETWCKTRNNVLYRASCCDDKPSANTDDWDAPSEDRWRPSIHMPRWASRIELEVLSVRVERVRDIREADAIAEGFADKAAFLDLFFNINKRAKPESNPWVWVVEFKRGGGGT